MLWIAIFVYLLAHFVLYATVLRGLRPFRSEGGIFLYHFVSAIFVSVIALVSLTAVRRAENLTWLIGVVSAHGIYSLSFLEFWALSEGSYSLRVLTEVARRGVIPAAELEALFVPLSGRKKAARLGSLMALGLVLPAGAYFRVTWRGAVAARLVAGLVCLSGSGWR